ncbi:hypothetical protein G7Y89_g616 [Cudoniella acicularis]|uniref:WSC domain-containing protein n=1 Tax=Cudoniella acicularis TaxID=354080 RepID=A0A8H4RXV3_9HELO|nr:hypothetical protein G7Y89_g616 [Cudoniella acicularis]
MPVSHCQSCGRREEASNPFDSSCVLVFTGLLYVRSANTACITNKILTGFRDVGARTLSGASYTSATAMTDESCISYCIANNYVYAGTEYSGECYCGNFLATGASLAPPTDCSMACSGNSSESCGGPNRLTLFWSGTAATSPSNKPSVGSFNYYGCYTEANTDRALQQAATASNLMTIEFCAAYCSAFTYFGTEYGRECYCGNSFSAGSLAAPITDCSMLCANDTTEYCGAGGRLSVYALNGTVSPTSAPSSAAPTTSSAAPTGFPSGWSSQGCWVDGVNGRILNYQQPDSKTNSLESCVQTCAGLGYTIAGAEYGAECYCDNFVYNGGVLAAAQTDCNVACPGTPSENCGGGGRLSLYSIGTPQVFLPPGPQKTGLPTGWAYTGCIQDNVVSAEDSKVTILTFPYMVSNNNNNTPTTCISQCQLFGYNAAGLEYGSQCFPLIASQAVTGKVTFLEKAGTGAPNATGAYELDLTQIANFSAAWRQMTRPQSDVFCSGSVTMPDKVGRQLNVGGWAGESNFGVRIYWPDGSAGVPGVNQWVEDPQHLQLQVPRWYPSAMVMANGSILVVGGEIGQNAAEQPTLEILPPTGVPTTTTSSGYSNTTKYLDFLDRTAPFNLYPWITVVPSGILIIYYNEARILDEVNFNVVKTLPNLPGAVNDPTGGRTYQLQGATVSLPQYAPYIDPLGVLVCGGSTTGGSYAIDNCVSTQPEAENPTWTIERMPSRRVMPCMAGLPDGTYVILGGGQHGVAGFGLAGAPNYNAVLYDPSKPVNQRMSIMANTTVARLYHSEAITLLDGRVMVSGSDPTGQFPTPEYAFPEEYRVEVFTPPYLLSGFPCPTFSIDNKDWTYNSSITFTTSAAGTIRVSLLGSVSSTHGNSMGQRTLFPAISCASGNCTVESPPTAHVCPPGWYMMFVLDGPTPSVGTDTL